jgi:hypothetical protein
MSRTRQKPHERKPTELEQGILYAAADLCRYVVDLGDVVALLRRQGLTEADCSDLEDMDKDQLRRLRDEYARDALSGLRGLD